MKPCVYITRKVPDELYTKLSHAYNVDMWPKEYEAVPYDILLEKAGKADALLTVVSDQIDENLLTNAKKLKVVANMAVGFDNIDVKAASKCGISVCNTPDVLTDTTADLTWALLLAAARRIVEAAELVKEGKWTSWAPLMLVGADVHHKTIGIVGMGKIGTAVAKRAAGFDMTILYCNRSRNKAAETNLGAQYSSFEELLTRADFVVCLAPLTESTKGMFQRKHFQMMKKEAVFINASRGLLVSESALMDALQAGDIAAAGLDVFESEPIKADHPLLTMPNVVALPHIGSASKETRFAMMTVCCDNIDAILTGQPPKTLVNSEVFQ